jgi:hypothetical protein
VFAEDRQHLAPDLWSDAGNAREEFEIGLQVRMLVEMRVEVL